MNILEIDSIQKSFDYKKVLTDVYLRCQTGEIIGLLGRNGSGKSVMLKIVCGLLSANFKFVRINGAKATTDYLIKEIAYLSQNNFIPQHLTVQKVILLSICLEEQKNFKDNPFITTIINRRINELSGGELRFLEIMIVLSNRASSVLLDEPYNGLSPLMIEQVNSVIVERSKIKGIIITDHNYTNILALSTKLVVMRSGKLYHLNDNKELTRYGYLNLLEEEKR
ncbi:MAG TPA: ATP-binding cassette domain-containing protein [Flavobacterium sp.]|jgi:ABC-type multidrug transport system ATPase subunit